MRHPLIMGGFPSGGGDGPLAVGVHRGEPLRAAHAGWGLIAAHWISPEIARRISSAEGSRPSSTRSSSSFAPAWASSVAST